MQQVSELLQSACFAVQVMQKQPRRCNGRADRQQRGLVRDLNPGPLAPKARIIPLDQRAYLRTQTMVE